MNKRVCEEQLVRYTDIILNTNNSGKTKWKNIKQMAREQ